MTSRSSGDPDAGRPPLRATLHVVPHPAAHCAVLEAGSEGEAVKRDEIRRCDGDAERTACRAAVTVDDGDGPRRRLVAGSVEDYCVCPAFRAHDCVADLRAFRDGALEVDVTVPQRSVLRELVEDLREREAGVRLEQVVPLEPEPDDHAVLLDAASITPKQREAVTTAVEMGYYDSPREADLGDVASALGVSRSAASQRLNAAEATLVEAFTGHVGSGESHGEAGSSGAGTGAHGTPSPSD